jgi:cyclopropane fatty-acyl-phospholipid synthase-like methyltransferase
MGHRVYSGDASGSGVNDLVSPARAAARSFRGAPLPVRAFVVARLLNAPLGGLVEAFAETRGRVFSVGCGYGIVERFLAEANPSVAIEGIELDRQRVQQANAVPHPRVAISTGDVRDVALDRVYNAILAIDVFHHIPSEDHGALLKSAKLLLRPGGRLLLKDIATAPAWKHRWNAMHDRLVAGSFQTFCRSPRDMVSLAQAAGFSDTRFRRLQRLSPYPHYLLAASTPPS